MTSSSAAEDFKLIDNLGALGFAEIIAAVALFFSIVAWFHSLRVEERIKADNNERSKFDIVFGKPLTKRIDLLEEVISNFLKCISTDTEVSGISAEISHIQKNDHTNWYFGVDAILESHDSSPSSDLAEELNSYWDQASLIVDEMGNSISVEKARDTHYRLRVLANRYLINSRRLLVEHRASISAVPRPILWTPFRKSKKD